MTRHTPDTEFDRLLETIRTDRLDDHTVTGITSRVWSRLQPAEAPLRGCEDVRTAIPALVAGALAPARARLVEDHTRSCVPCRRALLEARGLRSDAPGAAAEEPRSGRSLPGWLKVAAIAVVTVGAGLLSLHTVANLTADRALRAEVLAVDGALLQVGNGAGVLAVGDEIRSREPVRTSKDGGAVLRLDDGSLVELAPRSQVELRAGRRGTTIGLDRGDIIVDAADQRRGRLFVRTDACRVAVTGTVFAVDHGMKGSRVAVVEGEVEVRQSGRQTVLLPGDQITTSDRLGVTSVADQVSWSRDAEAHLALLAELTRLGRDLRQAVDEATPRRSSSRLLELAPEDSVAYVSIPNLTEGLRSARELLDARLAESPTLAAWWRQSVESAGIDREIDRLLGRIEPFGRALGDEIVIAVPAAAFDGDGEPLVLAELEDPAGFRALVRDELARLGAGGEPVPLAVVEDPAVAPAGVEMLLWIGEATLVAAFDAPSLAAVVRRLEEGGDFPSSRLGARLGEAYGRGVSWLAGVDLSALMADAADGDGVLRDLGLLDAETLVVEQRRIADHTTTEAALQFDGPRRGIAAWLDQPAPMGALELVSADAAVVVGVVTRDVVEMLDDVLRVAGTDAVRGLEELRAELGIDLRSDLAATLGGEAVLAVDGPLLPTPSWKLVLEVSDPATFARTLELGLDRADAQLLAAGEPPIERLSATSGGVGIRTVRHPRLPVSVSWATVDGYAVFTPSTALVERALLARASGTSLASSGRVARLLPANGYTDCSLLVYRDLGPLAGALPDAAVSQLPPAALDLLREGVEPGVLCAYGLEDRILLAAEGGSALGFEPLAGLLPALGGGIGDGPVSSSP